MHVFDGKNWISFFSFPYFWVLPCLLTSVATSCRMPQKGQLHVVFWGENTGVLLLRSRSRHRIFGSECPLLDSDCLSHCLSRPSRHCSLHGNKYNKLATSFQCHTEDWQSRSCISSQKQFFNFSLSLFERTSCCACLFNWEGGVIQEQVSALLPGQNS